MLELKGGKEGSKVDLTEQNRGFHSHQKPRITRGGQGWVKDEINESPSCRESRTFYVLVIA